MQMRAKFEEMSFVKKARLTESGLVRVDIKGILERNGKRYRTKQTFTGYGLTVAEAEAKALKKMFLN